MEITATRTGEQLVLSVTGRMDGAGAQQVTTAIQQNLTDHDTALIFDLGGVDYLSSAGLRVFQESARRMKERNGRIAVCRVADFVRKLFTAGGFFRVLAEYPSVDDALRGTAGPAAPASEGIRLDGAGWSLSGQCLAGSAGILTVTGNLSALHTGKAGLGDIRETTVAAGGFATGISAMAATREAASPLLGEMVRAGGSVWWIPTDGSLTPDFFTARDLAESGMKTFSLFSVSFSGPFPDLLRITANTPDGITLGEVYAAIFRYLKKQYPENKGICAVVLKATIGGVCSSDLKDSVIAAAADRAARGPVPMPAGRTVTEYPFEGTILAKASAVDVKPRYAGDILISVGYGIDPATARKTIPGSLVEALSYSDPRTPAGDLFLYNKGVVFRTLPWDNAKPFGEQVIAAPASGSFVAMHNLLSITTVRSAVAGILPVTEIRIGE
ncbi:MULTISPECIES: STAS domain-containing protein [unclassified Methanoregula]|uniref:STAS domain-containing protein n=1 Tax=unclassified Methanoregula TaxID=2649730 RepID=UPI0009CBEF31|nr:MULTISPECIES: STAS domain-containing protein [unclassified Methanoregula]OPX63717.1 MAG: STAS domain protein [Methanoregula sp. PtaB.Bin085]OPY37266.1 MAG: STAS domain protein [Methanoregula sp. PtaU1.Bin006]